MKLSLMATTGQATNRLTSAILEIMDGIILLLRLKLQDGNRVRLCPKDGKIEIETFHLHQILNEVF